MGGLRNDGTRLAFAEFLKRLGCGLVRPIEWNRFAVRHYRDDLLEDIRRRTVKLSMDRGGTGQWSDSEIAALQQWSRQLRGASNNS